MSDQHDSGGAVSNLEEVFLSREFGHARVRPRSQRGVADVALRRNAGDSALEQVLLSGRFGKAARELRIATKPRHPVRGGDAVILSFPARPSDRARPRALAALSGVAAAAIALSFLASTPGKRRGDGLPAIAAVGSSAPHGWGGARVLPTPPPAAPIGNVDEDTANGGSEPDEQGVLTAQVEPAPPSVPASSGGSSSTSGPEPGSVGGGAAGTVTTTGAAPVPPPSGSRPAGSTTALSTVSSAVGVTVTNVANSVTSTANQLATGVPATAPVVHALVDVASTVSALGHPTPL
jgi:hypothetical protein